MSVELKPKDRSQLQKVHKLVLWKRDLRPSSRFAFRKYLELLDFPNMFDKVVSCEGKSSLLETIITTGLNFIMPLRPTTVRCNEPPWMNPELSTLITKRQKALNQGNTHKFKYLRNRVNREKICRAKYYENRVQHLKQWKSSSWWNEVKKLSGANSAGGNSEESLKALKASEHHSKTEKIAAAYEINDAFLSPNGRVRTSGSRVLPELSIKFPKRTHYYNYCRGRV